VATAEDRAQAGRLLEIHQRNLNDLLARKAKYGDEAPIHLERQIETEEAAIESLKPFTRPEPPRDVQAFIHNISDGDWPMLFQQGVQQNMRLTRLEESMSEMKQQQTSAQLWRMEVQDAIRSIPTIARSVAQETQGRLAGQWRNLLFIFCVAVFVVANGSFTLAALIRATLEVGGMAFVVTILVKLALWFRGKANNGSFRDRSDSTHDRY
jgi:hypothetical protein